MSRKIFQMSVMGWDVNYCLEQMIFSPLLVEAGRNILLQWQKYFPAETNYTKKEFGVPSLIVRLDCVFSEEANLQVFEVEERPAGIGICVKINPCFAERLAVLRERWPVFTVLVSEDRRGSDDYLWTQVSIGPQKPSGNLFLIRAEPEQIEFHELLPFSVSSLLQKGNKAYGERMGWWKKVFDGQELPWDISFVLKPVQGSKARGLEIWDLAQNRPGSSTRSRILRTLAEYGSMYLQPLIDPLEDENGWKILRIFYGYDPLGGWICLGGLWNSRPNLRIHGAKDALFGPVVL